MKKQFISAISGIIDLLLLLSTIVLFSLKFKNIIMTILFTIAIELIRNQIVIKMSGITGDDVFERDKIQEKMLSSQLKYVPWLMSLSIFSMLLMSFI